MNPEDSGMTSSDFEMHSKNRRTILCAIENHPQIKNKN
jgi:hypothetical protein